MNCPDLAKVQLAPICKPVDKDALLAAVRRAYSSLPEVYHKKQQRTLPELPFFSISLSDPAYPGSLKKLLAYLANNYMKEVSLQSISQELMLNPNYLSSVISKSTGKNFTFLLDNVRIRKAAEFLLYEPDLSISEISYLVGYNHERRLYQVFQKRLNCTPGDFKKSYASEN
ncbi:helix-turn-helix domain-containing protein [Oscillospiraceae bacterium HV4-5-C5C]|nr:helix-turn-helix domain-containing protein [Oscillospiraceae bacterium HV4-5-C5C]